MYFSSDYTIGIGFNWMLSYPYQDDGDIFASPYQEIFHTYNPILAREREAALRRQLGEEGEWGHIFGQEEKKCGCCTKRGLICGAVAILIVCIVGGILLFHYRVLGSGN